ncbi:MAG: hypothetical protein NVS3B21_27700 [Acidimicrobiales bacterium]
MVMAYGAGVDMDLDRSGDPPYRAGERDRSGRKSAPPHIGVTGGGETVSMTTTTQERLPLADLSVAEEHEAAADQAVWRLDDRTREVGRRGLAAARAALAAAESRAERNGPVLPHRNAA